MVPAGPDLSRCLRVAWGAPEADVSSASAATGGRQRGYQISYTVTLSTAAAGATRGGILSVIRTPTTLPWLDPPVLC